MGVVWELEIMFYKMKGLGVYRLEKSRPRRQVTLHSNILCPPRAQGVSRSKILHGSASAREWACYRQVFILKAVGSH